LKRKRQKLYQFAANQGLASAQYHLGICYEFGQSVAKDEKKAKELYQLAANQGHKRSTLKVGMQKTNAEIKKTVKNEY